MKLQSEYGDAPKSLLSCELGVSHPVGHGHCPPRPHSDDPQ